MASKILKMPKLHLATSNDNMRPAMMGVYIDNNAGIATDGTLLVKVSLDKVIPEHILEKMNGMLLPSKMWAHFCSQKFPCFFLEDHKIIFRGPFGDILVRGINEQFPLYKNAVADWNRDTLTSIALNPKILQLINAIFDNPMSGLRLDFSAPNKPIRIVPNDPDHSPWECEALLMPQMLSEVGRKAPFAFLKSNPEAGRNEGEKC